ncbi:hypothetical protein SH501x_002742 [Pirellulaceae bacterium SH501]
MEHQLRRLGDRQRSAFESIAKLAMVLPLETAHELALTAAEAEWRDSTQAGDVCLPFEFVREFPWGWIFEAAVSNDPSDKYPGICVSVDRFSGKTQITAGASIANDDLPLLALSVTEIGSDKNAIFQLLRQLTFRTASDTIRDLGKLPVIVAVGPMMSIRSINGALIARGAKTSIVRYKA